MFSASRSIFGWRVLWPLRQSVPDLVVIALVGDKDMLRRFQTGRRVERARPDAHVPAVCRLPEELRAARAAKPTPRDLGGLVPAQRLGRQQPQILGRTRGRGIEMSARPAAHGAVTIDDGPKRAVNFKPHSPAQATATRDGTLVLRGDWQFGHGALFQIQLMSVRPQPQRQSMTAIPAMLPASIRSSTPCNPSSGMRCVTSRRRSSAPEAAISSSGSKSAAPSPRIPYR